MEHLFSSYWQIVSVLHESHVTYSGDHDSFSGCPVGSSLSSASIELGIPVLQ